jgi:hypothetical protein
MERCAEVEGLILEIYSTIRSGQPAGLDALIAAGEATLAVGTDPREWWTGQEAVLAAFRAQLQAAGGLPIEAGSGRDHVWLPPQLGAMTVWAGERRRPARASPTEVFACHPGSSADSAGPNRTWRGSSSAAASISWMLP